MVKLWYWVRGISSDAQRFMFGTDADTDVVDLQAEIEQWLITRHQLKPGALGLWKLTSPLSLQGDDIQARVQNVFENLGNKEVCTLLRSSQVLTEAFPTPQAQHLHVVVEYGVPVEDTRTHRRQTSNPPARESTWCPRKDTVDKLFEQVSHHGLVQVRGTPASGKSSLLALLYARILQEDKVEVFYYGSWPSEKDVRYHNWQMRLQTDKPWTVSPPGMTRYVLIDEAQSTYWDIPLWNELFKTAQRLHGSLKVVLFCSYGSPGVKPVDYPAPEGTPLTLPPESRVSLRPSASGIGLCFTRAEYNEFCQLASMRQNRIVLAQDLMDALYTWTSGHVGMIETLFAFLVQKHRKEMRAGSPVDLAAWYQDNYTFGEVSKHLQAAVAGRGLPEPRQVQKEASTWRKMLQAEPVVVATDDKSDFVLSLQRCHVGGWIQSDLRSEGEIQYTFPSPIHFSHVSWLLEPLRMPLPFTTPFDMAVAVINCFRPSQLYGVPRGVGGGLHDRPPEAQYQNEFYRHLLDITQGGVGISPEFASAVDATSVGRIDFFILGVDWGVECVRDGDRLVQHSQRFDDDQAYGKWLVDNHMSDYILLDFRWDFQPQRSHPDCKNLFHVIFSDNGTKVEIWDNQLTPKHVAHLLEKSGK
ncbi:hypothetical protein FRB95_009937 [Tulasnella sp. JGI-2019a]|nr:hypothetical protein FRB95_009937 [Tulasnella sp. JGI-2019a]